MSVVLLGASATVPGQGASADGELLRDPGFSEDADGNGLPDAWSTSARQVRWREKVYLSRDYEIVSQTGQYVLATQDVALRKGQTYTLTLVCRGEDGALAGALILHGDKRPQTEMPLLWNVEPTGEYEEYTRTFVAPDPVARLYLYNVARQGTVAYDRVSLREGKADRPVVSQLSFHAPDRPFSGLVETRHIDWAVPLSGGPVKAFITLRSLRCLRDVTELGERLEIDADTVANGESGDQCSSQT